MVQLSLAPEPGSASRRLRERGCAPSEEQALLTAAGEPACGSEDQRNENFSIKKIKIEGDIKQK